MNDTTALPTTAAPTGSATRGATVRADVMAYVARVRAALSDLAADELDELTQGMEADLAELAAESGDVRTRLGSPETYAAELRTAAGYPPRTAPREAGLGAGWHRVLRRRSELVAKHPWLRDLQPVWWCVRGVVVATIAAYVVGADTNLIWWLAGAALSFWLGRSAVSWVGPRRGAVTALNVVMFLAALVVLPIVATRSYVTETVSYVTESVPVPGLANDGEPVTTFLVYDSTGHRVELPRVFDQNGHPLLQSGAEGTYTPPPTIQPLVQPMPSATTPAQPAKPGSAPTATR
ncbi:hypothetical protein GCM10027053_49970 [Intrasporangium mesophilum]